MKTKQKPHGNCKPKVYKNTHTKTGIQIEKYSHQITRDENKRGKEEKKTSKNNCKTITKMPIRTYLLKIILNTNGLNTPTKTYTLAKWIQKQDPYMCRLQETHFRSRGTY